MNRAQLIVFGAIGVIVLLTLLLLTGALPGLKPRAPAPFSLELWGTADPPEIWQRIAADYREVQPAATIAYVNKDLETYETELINALAAGRGPDIFLLPDVWIAKHRDKLRPLPEGSLGYERRRLGATFADGLAEAMADETGALLGVPLAFDTLALFYNRDHFNTANIPNPPAAWDELAEQAKLLTRRAEAGTVTRAGAAIGTAANVAHAADILLALILGGGGKVIDPETGRATIRGEATQSALSRYTAFADATGKTYAWNAGFDGSLRAFARGEAAMAFGYAADIKAVVALNPQLNFDVALLPQRRAGEPQVNVGRFGLLTVSRTSRSGEEAWRFLLWLENRSTQKAYADALGLPPARRDLVGSKPPRDYLLAFYDQVLSARALPIAGDDWLPRILGAMIDDVASRRFSVAQAIDRAELEINRMLRPSL